MIPRSLLLAAACVLVAGATLLLPRIASSCSCAVSLESIELELVELREDGEVVDAAAYDHVRVSMTGGYGDDESNQLREGLWLVLESAAVDAGADPDASMEFYVPR